MTTRRQVLVLLGWSDPRFLEGIARFAREHKWCLELRPLFEWEPPWSWNGDGLLLGLGRDPRFNEWVFRLAGRYPAVSFSEGIPGVATQTIRADHAAGGRLAAQYFLERGYRHFAWFEKTNKPLGEAIGEARGLAFREMVEAGGRTCAMLKGRKAGDIGLADWKADRQKLLEDLLRLPKPLALFAADDLHAVEIIELCLDAGLRVPEDVAVLGVGNIELACECSMVPISSIEYDHEGMAYAAAGLLDQVMAGNPAPDPVPPFQPVRVVSRRSTDRLATEDVRILGAIRFMREHLARDIGVEDIAEGAGVPSRTLQTLFKEQLARGPARFLLQLRLDQARRMLSETDLSIEAVAATSGFKSPRNINRCFHRELGISPMAYRQTQTSFVPDIPEV